MPTYIRTPRSAVRRWAVVASLAALLMPFGAAPSHAQDALIAADASGELAVSAEAMPVVHSREGSLPAAFDMREKGWVTPVKLQDPWGACWSFGAISAAEVSIRSELMQAGAPQELIDRYSDLSERHLAWFAFTPVPHGSQAGEGGHNAVAEKFPNDPDSNHMIENAILDAGGSNSYATSLFSSGIGPVLEGQAPYRNDEGLIEEVQWGDVLVPGKYSAQGTWALAQDLMFNQAIELEETFLLPSLRDYEPESEEWEAANDAIKGQLVQGRAVAVNFHGDTSLPGALTDEGYMNPGNNAAGAWAQYTYERARMNHAAAIVGWDDDFSAENFGNPDPETGEVDPATRPAGDGAWIVKSSWGGGEGFPNGYPNGWGTDENDDGVGDGCFYLSYYDRGMARAESFDFDTTSLPGSSSRYVMGAHDFMPATNEYSVLAGDELSVLPQIETATSIKTANVFTAETDRLVCALACETSLPGTSVTYEVYRMPEGETWSWDRAELVLTKSAGDPYEFGGFHRTELAEDERVAVREGQMYAVVVRMHCAEYREGDFYIEDVDYLKFGTNDSKQMRDKQVAKIVEENIENTARSYLEMYPDLFTEEEEAYEAARETWMDDDMAFTRERLAAGYFKGVVNEGESYLNVDGTWTDWAFVKEGLEQDWAGGDAQVDNPSIKAYAEAADFSEEEPDEPEGPGEGEAEDPGEDGPGGGESEPERPATPKGDLPQTGDASTAAAVAVALAGGGVAALGTVFRRRR